MSLPHDRTSQPQAESVYSLVSPSTSTIASAVGDSSTNLVPASGSQPPSRPISSFWKKLKAENEDRKQKERQTVSVKEATKITGHGDEGKPYAYSDGAVMELLFNGYVDPNRKKSREDVKKLVEAGKHHDSSTSGRKA